MTAQSGRSAKQQGELSAGDLDVLYKLAVSREKLLKADQLEMGGGYSGYEGSSRYYRDDGMGMSGDSYGRHWVRGHYSRDGYDGRMRR